MICYCFTLVQVWIISCWFLSKIRTTTVTCKMLLCGCASQHSDIVRSIMQQECFAWCFVWKFSGSCNKVKYLLRFAYAMMLSWAATKQMIPLLRCYFASHLFSFLPSCIFFVQVHPSLMSVCLSVCLSFALSLSLFLSLSLSFSLSACSKQSKCNFLLPTSANNEP